jgi:hypothetical protein
MLPPADYFERPQVSEQIAIQAIDFATSQKRA